MTDEHSDTARLVEAELNQEDHKEKGLRPKTIEEFIGQPIVKEHLTIFIQAAKQRQESIEHLLFYGPPGLGKTTLASIIAAEMQSNLKTTAGPAIERPGDLASILTNLQEHDILFIDEIHRLNHHVEEVLYSAMEDFALDIVIGKGPAARSIRLDLPSFTLIGATTRMGLLTAPLRDRFGIIERLNFYDAEDLQKIIIRSATLLELEIDSQAAANIATCSRGTPRIANRLLKRVRDWALVKSNGKIGPEIVQEALHALHIDRLGLDDLDRRYLSALIKKFKGGPVGLDTLAACLAEDASSIEDVIEPFLLQLGFIERSPRGRKACKAAYEHMDIAFVNQEALSETNLFNQ
ncbi:MAG: Holliday junction branch migration DNA helicase RuvB [bacterium]